MIAFGKYRIIKKIFVEEEPGLKINYNESNYKKFVYIFNQLENFHQKCKNNIKDDDLLIAKLFFTASIALEEYLKSSEYSELKEDLIDLIDFKKEGTIYNSAYEDSLNLIMNFSKESFLYPIFLQLNSGFKKSLYDEDNVSICMGSKLTLQQIKLDLIKSLAHYGIRIFFKTIYLAETICSSGITIYNEKGLFDKKLSDEDLLTKNDSNFQKRTIISFLQKHEIFSHFNKVIISNIIVIYASSIYLFFSLYINVILNNKNKSDYIDSQRDYEDFSEDKIVILNSKNDMQKTEEGGVNEYFLSNGNKKIIDNLYQCRDEKFNFKNLFNIDLFLNSTNEQLINVLKSIPESEKNEENNIIKSKIDNKIDNNKFLTLPNTKKEDTTNYIKNKFYYTDEFIEAKNKLKNEDRFRKFTFARNTIIRCKFVNHRLVPDED